jgi:hypothetical protein
MYVLGGLSKNLFHIIKSKIYTIDVCLWSEICLFLLVIGWKYFNSIKQL